MRVSVFGAGPSGMMAAWAAIQWGADVRIYDKNPETVGIGQNHGVFAMWDNCDLFLTQQQLVKIGIIGGHGLNEEQVEQAYATKVYDNPGVATSIKDYINVSHQNCYNHAEAYQQILEILGKDKIHKFEYKPNAPLDNYIDLGAYYSDVVICTIPADVVFPDEIWPYQNAYIQHSPAGSMNEAFMIYNVNHYIPWYRCSAILGSFSMEYANYRSDSKATVKVKKVLPPPKTPAELSQGRVICTGRYGAWDKNMLTEDVYYHVLRELSAKKRVLV